MPQFIATCPPGFEYLLVDELNALGVDSANEGLTQVMFDAEWPIVYRVCLWSRLANRILYPLSTFTADTDEQLYDAVRSIDWDLHLSHQGTLAVDFVSRRSKLSHQRYGALKIKDAVVDYFRDEYGERPSVDTETPDVRLHCRVNKNQATLCIDLSGKSLHQRGYRQDTGDAPIKENFAALMLYRSGWPEKLKPHQWLYDPMCGAGTIVIEAAMMAADMAPGLHRLYWGFTGWKPFHRQYWESELDAAHEKYKQAIAQGVPSIYGSDKDPQVLAMAIENAKRAGVEELIQWQAGAFQSQSRPASKFAGNIVTNPPYGERLEQQQMVAKLYSQFGQWLKEQFVGDHATILSAQKEHGHALGIRADKIYRLMNGPIECELLKLPVETSSFVTSRRSSDPDNYQQGLSEQAKMLANRLQKNIASLKSFLKQQNIESYRIYDADLPDYSAAIDVYDDCLHIQEYAPPKTIDSHKAQRRLRDIERVAAGVLSISADKVFVKTRARQKGDTQYEKQALQHKLKIVSEANAKFELNLSDYLDTGLFLDHRKVRAQLAKWSDHNTRLLNLFCYTGSASVQAALKGAKTVNVDLSNTYLDWAKRNYALNGLNTQQHQFIRANCIEWLEQVKETHAGSFDLIFIDPPTFSNSKKMEKHFDIQQEHEAMLKSALVLLKPGGKMIFSNNFKRFKMAFDGNEQGVKVKEMTRETTSRDFSKKPLHRSWLIEKS